MPRARSPGPRQIRLLRLMASSPGGTVEARSAAGLGVLQSLVLRELAWRIGPDAKFQITGKGREALDPERLPKDVKPSSLSLLREPNSQANAMGFGAQPGQHTRRPLPVRGRPALLKKRGATEGE